ncbi:hypothetical protein M9458_055579 [Cirrhinus mrigala]|uniref:Uncharacterized protein n=1 Tax=Cirrhinus mrigala TaxID=683832 RepID=A0ABD0MGH1_CIRMR
MKMNFRFEWNCLALCGREPQLCMLGLSGPPGTPCAGSGSPWVPPHGQQSEDVADEGQSEESEERIREAVNRLPLSSLEAALPGGLRTNGNFHLLEGKFTTLCR